MADTFETLLSSDAIQAKVGELAARIDADYHGEPLLLVGILKGSIHFLSDLARALNSEAAIEFMQTSSFGMGKTQSGNVQLRKDLDTDINGLNVLLVEDIVDTGTTLNHLRELLATRRPKTLRVVALLSKPEARKIQTPTEYVGFEIPNEFVVGYGLDYAERFRNLPYIAILREG